MEFFAQFLEAVAAQPIVFGVARVAFVQNVRERLLHELGPAADAVVVIGTRRTLAVRSAHQRCASQTSCVVQSPVARLGSVLVGFWRLRKVQLLLCIFVIVQASMLQGSELDDTL